MKKEVACSPMEPIKKKLLCPCRNRALIAPPVCEMTLNRKLAAMPMTKKRGKDTKKRTNGDPEEERRKRRAKTWTTTLFLSSPSIISAGLC
jgi:hypothetical protein